MGNSASTLADQSQQRNTSPNAPAETCPVDHKAREAWLQPSQTQNPNASSALQNRSLNHPPTSADASSVAESCPVDQSSRRAWLKLAQQQQQQKPITTSTDSSTSEAAPPKPRLTNSRLSTHREISTIPRGFSTVNGSAPPRSAPPPSSATDTVAESSASQAALSASHGFNAQTSDPHTSDSGTWIYPSEEMFFNAMRRKSFSPREKDMPSVIPIHNAVNERTWAEILRWEAPYNAPGATRQKGPAASTPAAKAARGKSSLCGGPRLISFAGDSTKLSPRARWNVMLGYEKPFDRHDWVVDRCGTRVEYIIDYYQGKALTGERASKGPSFYLDVRPKINTVEGVKMRMMRFVGLGR